jgi:hypothetical protein
MSGSAQKKLIERYERCRRLQKQLSDLLSEIEAELVELEEQLPDEYTYPGDPPPSG